MTETFATTVERLRDLVASQVAGYRRLLESTRAGDEAMRTGDVVAFEHVLAEQVEALRDLQELSRHREAVMHEVGRDLPDGELRTLEDDLHRLATEVSRATRRSRFVIERNGSLVEARLALHRRASNADESNGPGIDRIA